MSRYYYYTKLRCNLRNEFLHIVCKPHHCYMTWGFACCKVLKQETSKSKLVFYYKLVLEGSLYRKGYLEVPHVL